VEQPRVLGIMGSPRLGSNTEILLDAALAGAAESGAHSDKVVVARMRILPCLELYHCAVDGTCSIRDDMRQLYDSIVAADCILLASPVFFYGLSSQAKAVVDRCQALWVRRHVLKTWNPDVDRRRGALIAVGATSGAKLFDGVLLTARYFFDAVGVSDAGRVLVRGIDGKAEVLDSPEHIERARLLGRALVAGSDARKSG
jgi:multimeric flavodoxin WrbA